MDGNVEFFREVIEHPHIVITGKEDHRNAGVGKLGQFALQPDKSLWNGMVILEPKIKDVTHQVNAVRFVPDRIQPSHNSSLTRQAV